MSLLVVISVDSAATYLRQEALLSRARCVIQARQDQRDEPFRLISMQAIHVSLVLPNATAYRVPLDHDRAVWSRNKKGKRLASLTSMRNRHRVAFDLSTKGESFRLRQPS
jgi:hypothetical protein